MVRKGGMDWGGWKREEIRVSAGGIVWSPLGIECFGDIEGRKLKGNLSGC